MQTCQEHCSLWGFLAREGAVHERTGEQLRRWGLFTGITPETAFLCFVLMKLQIEELCWFQLRQPSSRVKDWTRNCLELHSFILTPWIPPKSFSESPASLHTLVSMRCQGAAPLSHWQRCGGWLWSRGNWGELPIILIKEGTINGWNWPLSRQTWELLGSTDKHSKITFLKTEIIGKIHKFLFFPVQPTSTSILHNLLDFRLSDTSRKPVCYWSCKTEIVWVHVWTSAQPHGWLWGITEKKDETIFFKPISSLEKYSSRSHREWVPIYSVNTVTVRFMTTSLITLIDTELPQNSFISRQTWHMRKRVRLQIYS